MHTALPTSGCARRFALGALLLAVQVTMRHCLATEITPQSGRLGDVKNGGAPPGPTPLPTPSPPPVVLSALSNCNANADGYWLDCWGPNGRGGCSARTDSLGIKTHCDRNVPECSPCIDGWVKRRLQTPDPSADCRPNYKNPEMHPGMEVVVSVRFTQHRYLLPSSL